MLSALKLLLDFDVVGGCGALNVVLMVGRGFCSHRRNASLLFVKHFRTLVVRDRVPEYVEYVT